MAHRVIVVDSPYEPEVEAGMIRDALTERFFGWTFSVQEVEDGWAVECEDKHLTRKGVKAIQLDLTGIENYANGFYDGVLALRG